MIVWGGHDGPPAFVYYADGARYDPATDTWAPLATSGAPVGRVGHVASWTGTEMIVWGGRFSGDGCDLLDDGARYDPTTDQWAPVSLSGAPSARASATAIWTGDTMIVWGGRDDAAADCVDPTSTGGRYDPLSDSWAPVAVAGAPAPREAHSAVWTGAQMIVWGGDGSGPAPSELDTGGRYDPVADAWAAVPSCGLSPRSRHAAVWTGAAMFVWSGYGAVGETLSDGALYDPP